MNAMDEFGGEFFLEGDERILTQVDIGDVVKVALILENKDSCKKDKENN